LRHSWGDPDKKGNVTCTRCGLEVPVYRKRRGGFGACEPNRWKIKKLNELDSYQYPAWIDEPVVTCHHCHKKVVNNRFCMFCAAPIHGVMDG